MFYLEEDEITVDDFRNQIVDIFSGNQIKSDTYKFWRKKKKSKTKLNYINFYLQNIDEKKI